MMRKLNVLAVVVCLSVGAAGAFAQDDVSPERLARALTSSDASARLKACRQLAGMGPKAKGAVTPLIAALKSGDSELSQCAALALGGIGPEAKSAVPALVGQLKSDDAQVRAHAAYALGRIGPAAQSAAQALIPLFTDRDPVVRRSVRDALKRIDAPKELTMPLMIRALKTATPADAMNALLTLAELGEKAVPGLCEALDNKDACYWACLALAEIGPQAEAAVPHLGKLLDSDEEEVRMQALVTLGQIGPAAKTLAPKISQLLAKDKFEGVRYAAAYALGSLGQKDVAIGALTQALDSKDPFLRVAGAWALLRLEDAETPAVKKAIRIVLDSFSSPDSEVRRAAARALSDETIPETEIGPALRKALEGIDDPDTLMQIAESLAVLGPKVVPACIRSLEEKRKLRFYAIQVLIMVGSDAAPAVPALMATLDDPDAKLRREAEFALGAIGPAAAKATEKLAEKLKDPDEDVRHAACYALGKIGPGARAAMPALRKSLETNDQFQRLAIVWAALKIAPNNDRLKTYAVPILIQGLTDKREHVRVEVAYQLGDMGDVAKPAVKALQKAELDESPAVREAATAALKKLQ